MHLKITVENGELEIISGLILLTMNFKMKIKKMQKKLD